MAVMKGTGLIIVSAWRGSLFQFPLQKERLTEKQIEPSCTHSVLYLLFVQVEGHEYLALSCYCCKYIKLVNLNKQKGGIFRWFSSGSQIQYEVITAFSGEKVYRMCHGEENRLFVESSGDVILELDTSTTTFKILRTINIGWGRGLCYVPDPHRLMVIILKNEVRAVSCDDKNIVWRRNLFCNSLLYVPSHDVILVTDRSENKSVCLYLATGLQMQSILLPPYVGTLHHVCLFNDQVIVAIDGSILYFSFR